MYACMYIYIYIHTKYTRTCLNSLVWDMSRTIPAPEVRLRFQPAAGFGARTRLERVWRDIPRRGEAQRSGSSERKSQHFQRVEVEVAGPTPAVLFFCPPPYVEYGYTFNYSFIFKQWVIVHYHTKKINFFSMMFLQLVGGLEHVLYSHLFGMSSSQLTKSYFFSTTNQ